MLMLSNGLSLSHWGSFPDTSRIAKPLTSSLKTWQSSTETCETPVRNNDATKWGLVVTVRLRLRKLKVKGKRLSPKFYDFC